MSAKETTINYLKSIRKNSVMVLKAQLRGDVSEKYTYKTMQYITSISIAIEAVKGGEGE